MNARRSCGTGARRRPTGCRACAPGTSTALPSRPPRDAAVEVPAVVGQAQAARGRRRPTRPKHRSPSPSSRRITASVRAVRRDRRVHERVGPGVERARTWRPCRRRRGRSASPSGRRPGRRRAAYDGSSPSRRRRRQAVELLAADRVDDVHDAAAGLRPPAAAARRTRATVDRRRPSWPSCRPPGSTASTVPRRPVVEIARLTFGLQAELLERPPSYSSSVLVLEVRDRDARRAAAFFAAAAAAAAAPPSSSPAAAFFFLAVGGGLRRKTRTAVPRSTLQARRRGSGCARRSCRARRRAASRRARGRSSRRRLSASTRVRPFRRGTSTFVAPSATTMLTDEPFVDLRRRPPASAR